MELVEATADDLDALVTRWSDLAKAIARERGCDHLKVSCDWHNEDARRFYRDAGFRPKQVDYAQPLE